MIQNLKNKISNVLNPITSKDLSRRIFHVFVITLIFLNIFVVILETVEELSLRYQPFFDKFEIFSITIFTLMILLVIASSIMYFVEHKVQPEVFSSIPAAMWWSIATLTTVGYGDIYPITPLGKLFGAIVAMFGIGTFAVPAGIIASGFAEELHRIHAKRKNCPHCGNIIDELSEGLIDDKKSITSEDL